VLEAVIGIFKKILRGIGSKKRLAVLQLKLLLASIAFLSISAAVGFFASHQEAELSALAISLYDNTVKNVDFSHRAKEGFSNFVHTHTGHVAVPIDDNSKTELNEILNNLDVTIEGAQTDKTRDKAKEIRFQIATLQELPAGTETIPNLQDINANLTALAGINIDDGLISREHADALVEQSKKDLRIALVLSAVASFAVTLFLFKAVLYPIKRTAKPEAVTSSAPAAPASKGKPQPAKDIARQVTLIAGASLIMDQKIQSAGTTAKRLAQSSDKLNKIVGLIGKIASQITQLSLTVPIEAARAAESGKGMTLVATEIKKLADQTSEETSVMATQVNDIQHAMLSLTASLADIQKTLG
jgi:hypothetical protein